MMIWDRIKEIRTDEGLSIEEFAEGLDLDSSVIERMETEGTIPQQKAIERICSKYRINEEWIFSGTGEKHKKAIRARDPFVRALVQSYGRLGDEEKDAIRKFFEDVAEAIDRLDKS